MRALLHRVSAVLLFLLIASFLLILNLILILAIWTEVLAVQDQLKDERNDTSLTESTRYL